MIFLTFWINLHSTLLLYAFQDLWEGMGQLQFSDILTELPVPPLAARVVGTFYCVFLKIIISF